MRTITLFLLLFNSGLIRAQSVVRSAEAPHRPLVHFSPKAHWMNDPNGMVFHKGVYHLFFQYYPDSTVWGPMHWGHAISKDLIHWQEKPIALYPDNLGYIFSGSAVVDKNNTSGFGKNGQASLVAIFTHHDPVGEKAGKTDFQNQSIAYSNDDGNSWTKYPGNPVIKNPGIADFRDPKVMWFEPQKKWVMALATKDCVTFFSSPNLKNWTKESEFGKEAGAHGGVWECPDLFVLNDGNKKVWVLIVSINPGGPNKGSATQYFLGDFDGKTFTPQRTNTKWIDYGADDYAGVTWSNTGNRKIYLGWMSNWQYANVVPTEKWRSATTLPRELSLKRVANELFVASMPVAEIALLEMKPVAFQNLRAGEKHDLTKKIGGLKLPCRINFTLQKSEDFSMVIANDKGEQLEMGYDATTNEYFIDRSTAGKISFEKGFAARHTAPRLSKQSSMQLSLVIDVSSVELFADDGLTVMTDIFFSNKPFHQLMLQSQSVVKKLAYIKLKTAIK